jgi:Zn-dependent protease
MIADLLIWYLVFVFSTTCHEAAHAWVAYRYGDLTAYSGGHVSLDPWPHIRRSPFGMVVIPLVSFFLNNGQWMIGWASVPIDSHWASRNPGRAAVMSFAGPLANLLLALFAFVVMAVLLNAGLLERGFASLSGLVTLPDGADIRSPLGAVARALSVMLSLNVILGVFNLIPLPPLDGASVLEGGAPKLTGALYARMREIPGVEFLGMLAAWQLSPYIVWPALNFVMSFL